MNSLTRQRRVLTTWILWVSIGLCVACCGVGLAIFFMQGAEHIPITPSGSLQQIFDTALHRGPGWHASVFLDLGILVLLLTPVARLAAGVYASARESDWLYAVIGLVVLGLLITGLIAGEV
jgi:uncharacterized membrane protein